MKKVIFAVLGVLALFNFSCNKATSAASDDPVELFLNAGDLLEAGKYNDSIKASKKAAELFKKDFSAYENGEELYYDSLVTIGEAYLRMGKPNEALKQFQDSLSLAPDARNILLGIVSVYFRLEKTEEAKAFFEKTIEQYKDNPTTAAPLYYYYAMHLSDAADDIEKAKEAMQISIENYQKLGQTLPLDVENFFQYLNSQTN